MKNDQFPFDEVPADRICQILDIMFPYFPDHEPINIQLSFHLRKEEIETSTGFVTNLVPRWDTLINYLTARGLATIEMEGSIRRIRLTQEGINCKKAGGIKNYEAANEAEATAAKRRQKLSDDKLEHELINLRRIKKTYWWTFVFSILALLISLSLLIVKIFIDK